MDLELLAAWQPTVIKGNAGEIGALAESAEVSRPSDVEPERMEQELRHSDCRSLARESIRSDRASRTQLMSSRCCQGRSVSAIRSGS
jgi:hypothetical protein